MGRERGEVRRREVHNISTGLRCNAPMPRKTRPPSAPHGIQRNLSHVQYLHCLLLGSDFLSVRKVGLFDVDTLADVGLAAMPMDLQSTTAYATGSSIPRRTQIPMRAIQEVPSERAWRLAGHDH